MHYEKLHFCTRSLGLFLRKLKTFVAYVPAGQLHENKWAAILDSGGLDCCQLSSLALLYKLSLWPFVFVQLSFSALMPLFYHERLVCFITFFFSSVGSSVSSRSSTSSSRFVTWIQFAFTVGNNYPTNYQIVFCYFSSPLRTYLVKFLFNLWNVKFSNTPKLNTLDSAYFPILHSQYSDM